MISSVKKAYFIERGELILEHSVVIDGELLTARGAASNAYDPGHRPPAEVVDRALRRQIEKAISDRIYKGVR